MTEKSKVTTKPLYSQSPPTTSRQKMG